LTVDWQAEWTSLRRRKLLMADFRYGLPTRELGCKRLARCALKVSGTYHIGLGCRNLATKPGRGCSSHVGSICIRVGGYRDLGIGTEILKTLIAQAEKMGLKMLTCVFSTNERAIHVYEKVGFRETGKRPKFQYRNGPYIDEVIMMKELGV